MIRPSVTRPVFPPGRYGRRREAQRFPRWPGAVLAGVVAVGALVLAVIAFRNQNGTVQSAVRSFAITEHTVRVTFDVRKPPGAAAQCVVRARDIQGREVGWARVPVPARGRLVRVTYALPTTARAVTGEVLGCTVGKR